MPCANESFGALSALPRTPGISRATASIRTRAGSSPPVNDVVADRDFLVDPEIQDALVDSFVMPAEENQLLALAQCLGPGVRQRLTLGREVDHAGGSGALGRAEKETSAAWIGSGRHDHPRAAAVGRVVGHAVRSEAERAQIVNVDLDPSRLARAGKDAFIERPGEKAGE